MKILSDFFLTRYGIDVRLVNESDAEFIIGLRTNSKAAQFISFTSDDANKQREWIASYKQREAVGKEYYFLYSYKNIPIGVSRVYNIQHHSFTSGSWIFLRSAPPGSAIIGGIIGKEIAFETLGLDYDIADIRKDNKNVIRFHKMFEPQLTGEDDAYYYYKLTKENFLKNKNKIIKLCSPINH